MTDEELRKECKLLNSILVERSCLQTEQERLNDRLDALDDQLFNAIATIASVEGEDINAESVRSLF